MAHRWVLLEFLEDPMSLNSVETSDHEHVHKYRTPPHTGTPTPPFPIHYPHMYLI